MRIDVDSVHFESVTTVSTSRATTPHNAAQLSTIAVPGARRVIGFLRDSMVETGESIVAIAVEVSAALYVSARKPEKTDSKYWDNARQALLARGGDFDARQIAVMAHKASRKEYNTWHKREVQRGHCRRHRRLTPAPGSQDSMWQPVSQPVSPPPSPVSQPVSPPPSPVSPPPSSVPALITSHVSTMLSPCTPLSLSANVDSWLNYE